MKRILSIICAIFVFSIQSAFAMDFSFVNDLTYEELIELYLITEARITELNESAEEIDSNVPLGAISDLFPDEQLAILIRDQIGKLSISQTVTQAELDKITRIVQYYDDGQMSIKDLTGIGYLRNLEELRIWGGYQYKGTELPDELFTLIHLETLCLPSSNLTVLSDKIGNLTSLRELNLYNTSITFLPDTIGNLVNLKKLYINKTSITELPESLYSLDLEEVSLPDGIK